MVSAPHAGTAVPKTLCHRRENQYITMPQLCCVRNERVPVVLPDGLRERADTSTGGGRLEMRRSGLSAAQVMTYRDNGGAVTNSTGS